MFEGCDFDFEEFDYLYHETDVDSAESINEAGLLVTGVDILGVKNIIETTTLPLPCEDKDELEDFFESEYSRNNLRTVNAVVILIVPKEYDKQIAEKSEDFEFSHIIPNNFVMGYVDLERKEFVFNPECEYLDNRYYVM